MTPDAILASVNTIVGETYLVGGCVRDMLLQRQPKDYDFATPLDPDTVHNSIVAAGRHAYTAGKRFGTVGFKVMDNKTPYYVEVTTFRSETYTPGSRKPEVTFETDLHNDLARRDFTMNAIAYDGQQYIDPFGGRIDLLQRKIKPVGKAKDRFKEDPLRMLRAARFAAQLDFEVDPNMLGVIRKFADSILTVSRERWVIELDKLLCSDNPKAGFDVLAQSYLLNYMLPEVWYSYLKKSCFYVMPGGGSIPLIDRVMGVINESPKDADLRWALFLSHVGIGFNYSVRNDSETRAHSAELVRGIVARLKFSKKRAELCINTASAGANL
jgi:poly(A) polymerase